MRQHGFFLAFDTSTDVMSIALTDGARVWQHTGPGGAKTSAALIPAILALLAESGITLGDLQAIAFGRGPGSFTGLRTACAVAQGLAFGANQGAGVPVLPIDTLLAVAEEARLQSQSPHPNPLPEAEGAKYITALLDARMDEMYMQRYTCSAGVLVKAGDCQLTRPEQLLDEPRTLFAGNVFKVYQSRLPEGLVHVDCLPTASAILRLAPALAAAKQCVPADQALPLYVRDKVAQTTDERDRIKALRMQTV